MKVLVPPAPIPAPPQKPKSARQRMGLIEAFDDGFIGRVIASMLAVGAVLMLGVLGATHSTQLASSVFGGIVLGAALLKSQELLVRKVLGPRAAGEKSLWRRAPLGIVLPLKYLFIGAALGIAIDAGNLSVPALAAGFIVSQMVLVAKVIGRFASLKMRA